MNTLCLKVFRKIGFSITKKELEDVVNSKPKAIENVLWKLYNKLVANGKIVKKEWINKLFWVFNYFIYKFIKQNFEK